MYVPHTPTYTPTLYLPVIINETRLNVMSFNELDIKLAGRHNGAIVNFARQSMTDGYSQELNRKEKESRKAKQKAARKSRRKNRRKYHSTLVTMAELPGGPYCKSFLFPADRKGPIKRKRPGAQIAPGHAMGKQVLGGFLAVFFYPLPVYSIIPRIAGRYWPPEKSGSLPGHR